MTRFGTSSSFPFAKIGFFILALVSTAGASAFADGPPIKVGWIGALNGPTAKWGAQQSALLGQEDVNRSGGINGRPLQLVFEDTGCNGAQAVSAFQKLTSSDNVSFILGGHCSPDSLAFAPLAERKKIVSIAAITSSPKLTSAGDFIFRVTPVSTKLAELVVPYATKDLGVKKLVIINELTDYVLPVAEKVKADFEASGGTVANVFTFNPGETDFRTMILKASSSKPDALYIGVQAPDTAILIMKQFRDLGLALKVFGNEQFGGAFNSAKPEERALLDNVIFAQAKCDLSVPSIKSFVDLYTERYHVDALPFSCYTAEAYDTVELLAAALRKCGEEVDCVKKYLYGVQNYSGASGTISFDENGDVNKDYVLQQVLGDGVVTLK